MTLIFQRACLFSITVGDPGQQCGSALPSYPRARPRDQPGNKGWKDYVGGTYGPDLEVIL